MQQLDQRINLYRKVSKGKAKAFSSGSSLWLLAAGACGMLLIQIYGYVQLLDDESRNEKVKQQLVRLQSQVSQAEGGVQPRENQLLKSRLQSLSERINHNKRMFKQLQPVLREKPVFVSDYLEGLAMGIPEGVWLTGIVVDVANGVELRGNAVNPAQAPLLIQSLASAPAFRGLTFEKVEVTKEKKKGYVSFRIAAGGIDEVSP